MRSTVGSLDAFRDPITPIDCTTAPSLPFVSVIIPVFNDAERLQRCLAALEQQSYPRPKYEVIVVDNGSSEKTAVAEVVTQCDLARLGFESQPGSYAARNRGVALAQGTVLAFTDADCLPARDWLEQGVRMLLQHPGCGFVAGQIATSFQDPDHPTPVELYESLWYPLRQQEFVEADHFGATANVFTFASVVLEVGLFDSTLKSSGDRDWGQRVYAAGYKPVYADAAVVAHPARRTWPQLRARARRIIGGRYDLQQKKAGSFVKRNALFLLSVAMYLSAPVGMLWFNLFLDKRIKTLRQSIQVSWVMSSVSWIYVSEMIRLKLGGESFRG